MCKRIDFKKKYSFLLLAAIVFMLLHCPISFSSMVSKNLVLMIDNSESMKKGDPSFLIKNVAVEFVQQLSDDTQLAVLIFDHRINMVVPLTSVSEEIKNDIRSSFVNIDYTGKLTDIPAAMERAIYELKTRGQEQSRKSIIFITDGIVDTGNKIRDIDKTRWMRENLIEDAARNGIQIFGIAFTDSADFELIQSMAQKTGGKYFRAPTPDKFPKVFDEIIQSIKAMEFDPGIPATEGIVWQQEPPQLTPTPIKAKKSILPIFIVLIIGVLLILAGLCGIAEWSGYQMAKKYYQHKRSKNNNIRKLF